MGVTSEAGGCVSRQIHVGDTLRLKNAPSNMISYPLEHLTKYMLLAENSVDYLT